MPSSSYVTAIFSVSPHAMVFRPKIRNTSSSIRSRWIAAVSSDEQQLKADWFILPTCWLMRSTPILSTRTLPAPERGSEPRSCGGGKCFRGDLRRENGCTAVHRQANRVGRHLRRPGGDRDRERAAVR